MNRPNPAREVLCPVSGAVVPEMILISANTAGLSSRTLRTRQRAHIKAGGDGGHCRCRRARFIDSLNHADAVTRPSCVAAEGWSHLTYRGQVDRWGPCDEHREARKTHHVTSRHA